MKFYSIKHVETKGIREIDGPVTGLFDATGTPSGDERYVRVETYIYERIGRDCFETRVEAAEAGIAKLKKARESVSRRSRRITARIGELCGEVTDGAL